MNREGWMEAGQNLDKSLTKPIAPHHLKDTLISLVKLALQNALFSLLTLDNYWLFSVLCFTSGITNTCAHTNKKK